MLTFKFEFDVLKSREELNIKTITVTNRKETIFTGENSLYKLTHEDLRSLIFKVAEKINERKTLKSGDIDKIFEVLNTVFE
ncbi:MAG TPA: hypothetical protein DEF39_02715 [Hungateiclostridium thermocellum]|jgi:hypothetical protein|nr:hypothetical protein [Acetivibrio thermocellus]CDG35738.1 hypothetical protein CTHBC1_1088 [Acetivibrio thermocellus BC1]ADU74234.1 hypothetical protein Clo1313_1170 [Acetivibrio thermocellus DSM 1313]ALX08177.1 hypothetical protein AD2_01184 [Acetivibrio thermocellus AD2]ANV75925.1 hypothetical protein LQRI_1184 [Acetivibrio thermocellus DSM 2360]EIC05929.1 hypothetical protein YSBL_0502 [Acetivibrio thermocellus YS]